MRQTLNAKKNFRKITKINNMIPFTKNRRLLAVDWDTSMKTFPKKD